MRFILRSIISRTCIILKGKRDVIGKHTFSDVGSFKPSVGRKLKAKIDMWASYVDHEIGSSQGNIKYCTANMILERRFESTRRVFMRD